MSSLAFDRMTPEQQARFRARVEGLGVPLDEALATSISTAGATKPVVLSANLERTVIPPRIIAVKDIATLKKHGGVPDGVYTQAQISDKNIKYPPPWDAKQSRLIAKAGSRSELATLLGPEQRRLVREAMDAWMLGNSQKVRDYEEIINALHFPVYAANWTMDHICVAAGTTFVIEPPSPGMSPDDSGPTLVVTNNVCIEQGGVIQFQVHVSVQVMGQMQLLDAGQCQCAPSGPRA